MKKTLLIFWWLFVIGLVTTMFFSCSENDMSDKKKPDLQTQTGNAVYVLDSKTVTEKLQSIGEEGTLTFSDLPNDKEPEANDIICSAPTNNAPRGFLYRVKNITKKGGQTIIETQEVSLEEAIQKGNVSETINLDDHIVGVYDENGNPLEYTSSPDGLRAGVASKTNINISYTLNGVKLAGNITIDNKLEFEMNIEDWSLQYMKFAYTNTNELKATVSGELKGNVSRSFTVATIKLTPITVLLGGVPVVVTPEIPIKLRGELNGTMKGEFTLFDSENSITVGVKYENKEVSGIFEKKSSENKSLASRVNAALSGEFKTTVEPGLSLLLYNSKNVSIGATIGIYGKAKLTVLDDNMAQIIENLVDNRRYDLNPEFKISIGAELSALATLKLISWKLLDYKATKQLFETELLQASVFPQFTDISFSNETNNSFTATATVSTPSLFNLIFPVSQYGICVSQNSFPTVENSNWHNTLGELPTMWTNTSVPIASAELKDLKKGTYYVCPYFLNIFGTFYGKVKNIELKGDDDISGGDWVLINGVKWATRNVGAPGTFVKNPEDYGEYYQWNKGTTDFLLYNDYYNSSYMNSTTWLPANAPSPAGYRVPTFAEIQSLTNTTYVTYEWTTRNGIYGGKFTDKTNGNSIFLPAAGSRDIYNGTLYNVGDYGHYWSSTQYDSFSTLACSLYFDSGGAGWAGWYSSKSACITVRPVAE